MFEKLYTKLTPVARGRYILPGLVLIILFNTIFFRLPPQKLLEENTLAFRLLDLKFCYTPEQAYSLMESYGPEARTLYWKMALVVDNPYAVVYGIAFLLILVLAFSVAFPDNRFLKVLAFLPVLGAIADIFENGAIAYMLITFPEERETFAKFASLCTSLKWGILMSSGGLFLVAVIKSRGRGIFRM